MRQSNQIIGKSVQVDVEVVMLQVTTAECVWAGYRQTASRVPNPFQRDSDVSKTVTLIAALLLLIDLHSVLAANPQKIDFGRDIRPILSDHCFACHGPDESNRKGGLRLDLQSAASKPAESGELAIVAGNAAASQLLKRVSSSDPDEIMPPPSSKKTALSEEQRNLLARWIDQGAAYSTHWAFQPPVRPEVPPLTESDGLWGHNPIDNFVRQRLNEENLKPSPVADRTTWLRRLSLDLIGLPPLPGEIDAYLADQSSMADVSQIERLLKSPHFGERWGRHWLDAARYADSDGFEKDKSRQMWFYRDWVINSVNRDMPYDRFVTEQLAGDLLPHPTQDQIVATGFLRNSMLNEEGGVDPEQFRMDAMFDRMDAIGKSILGLTIQCSQCHTHKYDPITHDEYYRLFAFLNNDHETQPVVYTQDQLVKIAGLKAQISEVESQVKLATPDWSLRLESWERDVNAAAKNDVKWTTLQLVNAGDNGQRYIDMGDGSILAQGYAPAKVTTELRGTTNEMGITAIRLELMNDPNLPCGGPGRSYLGTAALSEIKVVVSDPNKPEQKETIKFVRATADYGNAEKVLEANFYDKTDKRRVTGPVDFAIDGNDDTAWGIDAGNGRRNVARNAVFVAEKPFGFANGSNVNVTLKQNHGGWNNNDHMSHNLGRFRLSVTSGTNPVADRIPAQIRAAIAVPSSERSVELSNAIFSYWRTTVDDFQADNERIEAIWREWPAGSTSLTLTARSQPRETHLLKRGDFLKPDYAVSADVPAFLHPLSSESRSRPRNRLLLAEWLVDRRSPTTARVIVNRVWQAYFGMGLVPTVEDLGMQSELPSHPELLDWLAVELMEPSVLLPGETQLQPWSLKHLHRLITSSAVYRQASNISSELFERDQFNRFLARAPRLRVEGEIVRDIALCASGLLDRKVGGPSIFSAAPAFVFLPPASYAIFDWKEATGTDRYRRAIYTFRRRSTPYPMLTNFDTPNADFSCVRRTRSNTPIQALTTLNEAVFMEASRGLALLTLKEGGQADAERLTYAFRRCVSRSPKDLERDVLLQLLIKQKIRFGSNDAQAWELAANDPAKPPELPQGATPCDVAAWTVISRVLLNLDETVTKE